MSLTVREIFDAVAAGLATDPLADTMIAIAAERLDAIIWKSRYPLAVAYLAAHMLALSRRAEEAGPGGGGAGPVTGLRAGEVSVNYGMSNVTNPDQSYYATTPYGLEYLNLLRATPGAKMFVAVGDFFSRLS